MKVWRNQEARQPLTGGPVAGKCQSPQIARMGWLLSWWQNRGRPRHHPPVDNFWQLEMSVEAELAETVATEAMSNSKWWWQKKGGSNGCRSCRGQQPGLTAALWWCPRLQRPPSSSKAAGRLPMAARAAELCWQ